jgi:murein DD-endopeptidase MepM/ murein hydrolase activator NlpD
LRSDGSYGVALRPFVGESVLRSFTPLRPAVPTSLRLTGVRRVAVPVALAVSLTGALGGLAFASGDGARIVPLAESVPTPVELDLSAQESATQDAAAGDPAVATARASRDRGLREDGAAAPPPAPAVARPSDGLLTSPFGPRWGRLHGGIDLAAGPGSPVRAAAPGTVSAAGAEGAYGNVVRIRHADGVETVYAHLSAAEVAVGATVAAGEQIGREGNTGRSTGSHLHFEVRQSDVAVDPLRWLADRGVRI